MHARAISIAVVSLALAPGCANPVHDSGSLEDELVRAPSSPSASATVESEPVVLAGSTTNELSVDEASPVRFSPPPATLSGDVVHITEDLATETLVVAADQTLVVAHGTVLRATDWMDVRGTIETAPRDDSHDGASFTIRCDGPVHVGASGSISAGNGTTGDPERDGSADGGTGGALAIDCAVLVVDGVVRAGSGGAGGLGGSGGTGGGVHMTTADLWCLTPISERVGTQVNAGPGGAAGFADTAPDEGAEAPRGGDGGRNTYTRPDGSRLDAAGLAGIDPESILDYVVEAGFVWGDTELPAGFYPSCGWHSSGR